MSKFNLIKPHACGGFTKLKTDTFETQFIECEKCKAFVTEEDPTYPTMPRGMNKEENVIAWIQSKTRSPSR